MQQFIEFFQKKNDFLKIPCIISIKRKRAEFSMLVKKGSFM